MGTMAEAILRLCRSPARRHELRQLARQCAEELSWDACGDAIWRATSNAHEAARARMVK
jgi:glycosyltransferase involved in cell wall biosynthesis